MEEHLVNRIFPKTAEELALVLSNVTAGFFGFTLKSIGQQCGWDKVDSISRSLFRELGQLKTNEAIENLASPVPELPSRKKLRFAEVLEMNQYKVRIRDVREEDRPRNRMINYGAASLSIHELLSIIIRSGSVQENALSLAQRILPSTTCCSFQL